MKKILAPLFILILLVAFYACNRQTTQPIAEIGKPAPDFTLVDRKGKTWTLSKLKGQVVFINFWATWCAPCREEMPSMQRLYTSLPADKFKMLAILNNDEPSFADSLVSKLGCTFPILVDPDNKAGQAYGLTGVPETFIVDKQGILRQKFIGPAKWDAPGARQMMMNYINQ